MKKTTVIKLGASLFVGGMLLSACKKDSSSATGWAYNDPKNGGFEKIPYTEQETGPGLVLVEGGTFTMGRVEQDVMYDWNNMPRRVTVHSFYMDEAEVTNLHYREYLYWISRVWATDYPEVYAKALPDTLVWRSKLAYNEPYVDYYLRHPAYNEYPVVGISWLQANDYCAWRTDRVNEQIMIREGIIGMNNSQNGEDNFNTEAYLAGQYTPLAPKKSGQSGVPDLNPTGGGIRNVRMEDGILLPKYRLPTEAEWEYAAYALIGNTDPSTDKEIIGDRKLYPWTGHIARNPNDKFKGDFLANFRRGRGDYMGAAGRLNDNASITAPVYSYWPNDYGLYNMAGNVSEWVMDTYRSLSTMDMDDFNPYRGNVFKKKLMTADGEIEEKDDLGRIQYVNVTEEENKERRNYKKSDYRDNSDGDFTSSIYYDQDEYQDRNDFVMYEFARTSLLNNDAKVVKGGSWKDAAFWMVPSTRRFLDERQSTAWIGFRCAMDRVGSPVGLGKGKARKNNIKSVNKKKTKKGKKLYSK